MIIICHRRRSMIEPLHALRDVLTHPESGLAGNPWFFIAHDERCPGLVVAVDARIVWSTLWLERPDAVLRFDLMAGTVAGTELELAVSLDEPDPAFAGRVCARVDVMLDRDLPAALESRRLREQKAVSRLDMAQG